MGPQPLQPVTLLTAASALAHGGEFWHPLPARQMEWQLSRGVVLLLAAPAEAPGIHCHAASLSTLRLRPLAATMRGARTSVPDAVSQGLYGLMGARLALPL